VIGYRRATATDVDAIAQVHVQSSRETYVPLIGEDPKSPTVAQRRALWDTVLATDDAVFVATDDEIVVGFCHARDATMTTLCLLASHHRRGIGRALLQRLLATLAARGEAEVTFNVLGANANAIALYQAQGARHLRYEVAMEAEGPAEDIVFAISTAP
jgi:ribosomal protein S18 acetylase RimI-like enzyme